MLKMVIRLSTMAILLALLLPATASCDSTPGLPPEDEPLFGPGDYGGAALEGTEHLYNLALSPDGSRIALIRRHTPGEMFDPPDQLWIVNADGTNPEFIGAGVGSAHWSPDGTQLAITTAIQTHFVVFTLDLSTMTTTQWTGSASTYLSYPNANAREWTGANELLVVVGTLSYQQPYMPGTYLLNTSDGSVSGPLLEWMTAANTGNYGETILGRKWIDEDNLEHALSGNWARHQLSDGSWSFITNVPRDSVYQLSVQPSPTSTDAVKMFQVGNADQLFLMNDDGSNVRQITNDGGSNPRYTPTGDRIFFRRDTHRGPGAHWVPMVYDVQSGRERVLWPTLPDSVPQFPPVGSASGLLGP